MVQSLTKKMCVNDGSQDHVYLAIIFACILNIE